MHQPGFEPWSPNVSIFQTKEKGEVREACFCEWVAPNWHVFNSALNVYGGHFCAQQFWRKLFCSLLLGAAWLLFLERQLHQ